MLLHIIKLLTVRLILGLTEQIIQGNSEKDFSLLADNFYSFLSMDKII